MLAQCAIFLHDDSAGFSTSDMDEREQRKAPNISDVNWSTGRTVCRYI